MYYNFMRIQAHLAKQRNEPRYLVVAFEHVLDIFNVNPEIRIKTRPPLNRRAASMRELILEIRAKSSTDN